jgi:cellulose synthase (UDP-forming)
VLSLAATAAYLIWRAGWTIEGASLWIALPFLAVEIHNAIGLGIFSLALWDVGEPPRPRRAGVDRRVAVLIPTYNEPGAVLLPTIAAAVALEPVHETWVLDDGHRPEIRELASALGARYLTRASNEHAKAGNLNHALGAIDADVIAVLDSDHVPLPGFLTHTLGYFDDPRIAVVQTPQDFYNLDSFEHQRADTGAFSEQAVFYRAIGPGKNRWQGAFWCGTCALLRREALREVGGVAVGTLTEDIQTTIRLQRAGWKTVYHDEVLAQGLAAADGESYMLQRRRWATGAMQVLRLERPMTAPGLRFGQRLAYAATLFAWFDSWRTLAYQLLPVAILLTGAMPVASRIEVFGPIAATIFVLQFVTLRLLARGYYPPILSLIFEMLRMPAVLPATLTVFAPNRSRSFRVTPKGRSGAAQATPPVPRIYTGLLALGVGSLVWMAGTFAGITPVTYTHPGAVAGAAAFLVANQLLIVAAVRRLRRPAFRGERRQSYRFPTELRGRAGGIECQIADLSLSGARIRSATGALAEGEISGKVMLHLELPDGPLDIGAVIQRRLPDGSIGVAFTGAGHGDLGRLALAIFHHGSDPASEPLAAAA